jgi:predicted RNase H-like HicB family nuclease
MSTSKVFFDLPVSILKEGEVFVAYSPAVEVSTVGETFEEAQQHFEEAVNIFFEEIIKKGTLDEALTELGWQKKNNQFSPPMVVSHQLRPFSFNRNVPHLYA